MKAQGGIRAPDPKVAARYMQRFGFVLSEMTIERDWAFENPSYRTEKVGDPLSYLYAIETRAQFILEEALSSFEYRIYRELSGSAPYLQKEEKLAFEIRRICTLRRGIKPPYRGDLALAHFRLSTREALESTASDDEIVHAMLGQILIDLEERPMSIGGGFWR
ncbi:hypothetical protein AVO44_17720 [Ruegeria profundi]|uniref:Uncharacterized protein n=2 Tax=Ruegeria profundi TaxID=1685378 RepID=A0A0X3TN74_9RHOB|nr:hypothetical protein AVO44_17720 [Ruegeria profundi]